ncbi:membrane protein [Acidobacteria bacterium Mor1]|nr:membrane protein [Acidobacteria bacterium Mor1]
MSATLYRLLADLTLYVHVAFVAFVVFGLILILIGGPLGWSWVRNPRFRLCHLVAIGIVVIQAWIGVICPLTILEMSLRDRAGDATYAGSFIAHWFDRLLFYQAPQWVFTLCYTLFGAAVLASWIWVRPRPLGVGPVEGAPAGSVEKPE